MQFIVQLLEVGIVTCIFIMCASGVAGILYFRKLVLKWEKEENNNCPDKIETKEERR